MKLSLRIITLWAMLGAAVSANAVTVGVDPSQPWLGYMNVFNLPSDGGALEFGSPWATADLNASFSGSTLILTPNTIGDPAPYWYTPSGGPGATGNKTMDANMYVEKTGTLAGQTVTFTGTVLVNTLVSPYTSVAFIKDFAPDYSSFTTTTTPLVNGVFSISHTTDANPLNHVQYGFETVGPNVWVTDVASKGLVQVGPLARMTNGVHSAIAAGNRVSWTASSGNTYQPQKSANNSTWFDLGTLLSGSAVTTVFDAAPVPFYRVLETTSGLLDSVVNGGFELPNGTGGATNWSGLIIVTPPTRITSDFKTGTASMSVYVTNTTGAPGVCELNQNLADQGSSVIGGNTYVFSFWAKQISSGVSYVQEYEVTWYGVGDVFISKVGPTGFAGGSGLWTQVSTSPIVAPPGAVNGFIQIVGKTGAVANGYGGVLIDDVSLSTGGGTPANNVLPATVQSGVQISWASMNGLDYYVQSTPNLSANPAWSAFGGVVIGNGTINQVNDSVSAAEKFYRVLQIQ